RILGLGPRGIERTIRGVTRLGERGPPSGFLRFGASLVRPLVLALLGFVRRLRLGSAPVRVRHGHQRYGREVAGVCIDEGIESSPASSLPDLRVGERGVEGTSDLA